MAAATCGVFGWISLGDDRSKLAADEFIDSVYDVTRQSFAAGEGVLDRFKLVRGLQARFKRGPRHLRRGVRHHFREYDRFAVDRQRVAHSLADVGPAGDADAVFHRPIRCDRDQVVLQQHRAFLDDAMGDLNPVVGEKHDDVVRRPVHARELFRHFEPDVEFDSAHKFAQQSLHERASRALAKVACSAGLRHRHRQAARCGGVLRGGEGREFCGIGGHVAHRQWILLV